MDTFPPGVFGSTDHCNTAAFRMAFSDFDEEEGDERQNQSDITILKGILMLFVGGMCVAAGVFLVLLSTFGGTQQPPKPTSNSDERPPETDSPHPSTRPGHKLWWSALNK